MYGHVTLQSLVLLMIIVSLAACCPAKDGIQSLTIKTGYGTLFQLTLTALYITAKTYRVKFLTVTEMVRHTLHLKISRLKLSIK